MSVPAALMMRPAPMAPACRLARNRASYFSRRGPGASTGARAEPRGCTVFDAALAGFEYFSRSTIQADGLREMEGQGVSRFMAPE